jgi:hypothetical protein
MKRWDNRLTNVLDSRLSGPKNTAYAFDPVGNLQGYAYPNGVTNLYQYDALNRLKKLIWNSGMSTRAQFGYRLSPSGRRTNLEETVNSAVRTFAWRYAPLQVDKRDS